MPLGAEEEFTDEEQQVLAALKADDEQQATAAATTEAQPATQAQAQTTQPPQTSEQPAQQQPAASTTTEPAQQQAQTTQAEPAGEKPQGDVRAALRAARRSEQRTRQENERLARELEELRKKVPETPDPDVITDEDVAELEQDSPTAAKLARALRKSQAASPAATQPAQATNANHEFEPERFPERLQDAIDSVPDLLAWQHDPDQTKFAMAKGIDRALSVHPTWKDASPEDRFQEVARRVNAELAGTASQPAAATPASTPAARAEAAQAAANNAPRLAPSTLSDLGAGQGGQPDTLTLERMQKMSDDDIIAGLLAGG